MNACNKFNNIAYIGLGSNLSHATLGNPIEQIIAVFKTLAQDADIKLLAQSSLYQTKPLGPQDQPDFVNAVCKVSSSLLPLQLLDRLQSIEQQHERKRKTIRWGPRTLDLDLLLYNNERCQSDKLTLPHAQMHTRNFVLIPLYEISPDLQLPDGKHLQDLLKSIDKQGIKKLC